MANILSSNYFDLSSRLAAKAVPELIGEDAARFAAIDASLVRSLADLTSQLDAQRKITGAAWQDASDRDTEIRRLDSRLRMLGRYGVDLCLGRMVDTDTGATTYVGRLGLSDADGEPLLLDWRSPAAEPFFGATLADPMGLVSRRRYRWSRGRIVDYWDETFAIGEEANAGSAALDDQSAFIASLGADRSPRMRDVLGTIAADQDAVIRADSAGALLVDGGPGTGKTVVALHRAAYLRYRDPRLSDRRGGVLVVGPHHPYLSYVADVLPSLGEEGVRTCTLRELVVEGGDAGSESDPAVAQLKSSARLQDAIEPAVQFYEVPPSAPLTVETERADVELTATDWSIAFDAAEPGVPHNESREVVWDALLQIVVDKHDGLDLPAAQVLRSAERSDELRSAFSRAWPLLEAADVVGDLFTVPAYLRKCAPWLSVDEVRALQRSDPYAWTESDLPLLDAARRRIGDPDAVRRRLRRAAELEVEAQRRADVTADLLASNEFDDGEGLMPMLRQHDLQAALIDGGAAVTPSEPDELAGPFGHIVVDEAQELTDAQWQMLLRRCPSRSFTIVGDRAQASAAHSPWQRTDGVTESWERRLARAGIVKVEHATLSINYRTPEEVMREAEPVIRAAIPDANVPMSIRSNGIQVRQGSTSELNGIVGEFIERPGDGIACVIGDPGFAGSERVRSLTPALAKGLEFDLVVLVCPDDFGDGVTGAVSRYVAMTRATRQLVILT